MKEKRRREKKSISYVRQCACSYTGTPSSMRCAIWTGHRRAPRRERNTGDIYFLPLSLSLSLSFIFVLFFKKNKGR